MFCSDCGAKVAEGSKFCPNCGSKIASNTTPYEDKREIEDWDADGEEEIYPYDENKNYHLKEITALFNNTFKNCYFYNISFPMLGANHHISLSVQEQVKSLISNYPNEDLLMFVECRNELHILLTNYWIVFRMDDGAYIAGLEELKSLEATKKALTTIIRFVYNDDTTSRPIELDPNIKNVDMFISKFKYFIEAVHDLFQRGIENEREKAKEKARQEEIKNSIDSDFAKVVMNLVNDATCKLSIAVERGKPLTGRSAKYAKAKEWFEIPDYEDIYLIYDATAWGGCSKGFAICTSGIYYKENSDKEAQRIPWGDFRNVVIKYNGLTGLSIGNVWFAGEKGLKVILENIQNILPR